MAINSGLYGLKKDVIKSLSKEKLKQLIFHLTKRYYETYIECDEKSFNQVIEQLHDVIDEYKDTYINVMGFTFFCFHLNANELLRKVNINGVFDFSDEFNYDLFDNESYDEELSHDIRNILNKERVKERYYEKRTSEFIK